MAIISAFRGLRPDKELASRVASLPYDVLNSTEASPGGYKSLFFFTHHEG